MWDGIAVAVTQTSGAFIPKIGGNAAVSARDETAPPARSNHFHLSIKFGIIITEKTTGIFGCYMILEKQKFGGERSGYESTAGIENLYPRGVGSPIWY